MTKDELIKLLNVSDTILPQEILSQVNEKKLAQILIDIYNNNRELIDDDIFREKYTELVNYLVLRNLKKKPKDRNKELFNHTLVNSLISKPRHAV